jgi:hypothetical protein
MLLPAFERTFVMHYQTLMKRQMAGVAIAVRMYQIDHGRLPDTLGQLVPDYLAEVPQDPMGEPGTRIRYVNDPNTPLLYSVGRDGRDDGGNHKDLVDGVYACKDIPWFLNGRPVMPEKESAPDDGDD